MVKGAAPTKRWAADAIGHAGRARDRGTLARRTALAASVLLLLLAATRAAANSTTTVDAGRGPVTVYVPDAYTPTTPTPLVLLLHGYGWSGQEAEWYFQYLPFVDTRNFLYAFPNGRVDPAGNGFWDATDACCNFYGVGGPDDDSSYLRNLIGAIGRALNVDSQRVYLIGHSNGAFMSFRMACDHSGIIAAIVALAGATFFNPADCGPLQPVHVLEIHGTADSVVAYDGDYNNGVQFPGAIQTSQTWASYDGCNATLSTTRLGALDLMDPAGPDTDIIRYTAGCNVPGSVEHWRINDGPHGPSLSSSFEGLTLDYLFAHPKQLIRLDGPSTLTWRAVSAANGYNVYRGYLPFVDANKDGLPDGGYGLCVSQTDPNVFDMVFDDPAVPTPGQGFYYTLGYVDSDYGVPGGIGVTSAGQQRPAPAACP